MPQNQITASRPKGLLRLLLRLPNVLYRLGLGWMLGERFVMLHHVGRKTGNVHKTVVEVIGRDKATDTYYVASGWGYQADWYRNLIATPQIRIQVGRRALAVHAETLPTQESVQVLLSYRRQHPWAARELSRILGLDLSTASPEELARTVQESLPVVALRAQQRA